MGRYVLRRLIWTAFVLLIVTLLTFTIFYVMPPTDPTVQIPPARRVQGGAPATTARQEEVRRQLGLDRSLPEQYGLFVKHLVLGDGDDCPPGIKGCGWPGLGFSFDSRTSVRQEIIERAPRTISLALGAAVVWLVVGISIGIVSALRRRTLTDRLAMGFVLFGISAPVFWLGLMALFIFWQQFGIEAVSTGYVNLRDDPVGWFQHLILPWCVLALLFAAFYARMTRGNLIDTMGEDFIRTARAKGLSERKVVAKHGLRASLTPVVTMLGMDLALLLGGAFITEIVFNLQGLGQWAVSAASASDLPALIGVTVVTAFAVAILNLFVDIAYAYLDPRVRYS
jgi:peptide/nickel transport system permease protein